MASCKLCSTLGPLQTIEYNYNLAKEHAKTHFRQLSIIDDEMSLNKMVEKCFPENLTVSCDTLRAQMSHRTLLKLCHSIFGSNSGGNSLSRVTCDKCGLSIAVRIRGQLVPALIIDHVCGHAGLKLYKCRICARHFNRKSYVVQHTVREHRVSSIGNVESKLCDFVDQIAAEIKTCFAGWKERQSSGVATVGEGSVSKIRVQGGKMSVERQTLCRELITKYSGKDRKLLCRLCSKRIIINERTEAASCKDVLGHCYAHLQKPLQMQDLLG